MAEVQADFWSFLRRLRPHRTLIALNVLCNILVAIFTVISVPLMIPFFDILFQTNTAAATSSYTKVSGLSSYFDVNTLQDYFKNYIAEHGAQSGLLLLVGAIIVIYLLKNIATYFAIYTLDLIRTTTIRDLRQDMFHKVISLPLMRIKKDKKGDIISRFSMDALEIETNIFAVLEAIIRSPLIIIGCLYYMLTFSAGLTLFMFGLLVVSSLIIGRISKRLRKQSKNAQAQFGEIISITEESLSGFKTIKGFHAQSYVSEVFKKSNNAYRKLMNAILFRKDMASPLSEFLGILMVGILLWYGASNFVFTGEMDGSTFITFIFAFYLIINPAKSFSSSYFKLQKGLGAYERIQEVLHEDVADDAILARQTVEKSDFEKSIAITDLTYTYEDGDECVLDDINLTIQRGEKIALVGASGSGKTTLVDLLCRFYHAQENSISIDDVAVNNMAETSLRSLMSIVTQDPVIFNDTIRANVLFGAEDKGEEVLIKACKQAHAYEFIQEMEMGFETPLGDSGNRLSGGQKQRIALARALYRESPILILDEATSALDSKSEKAIQDALFSLESDKTLIIIAHRLNTVKNVDRIYVLDNGRIVEEGNHEELLQREDGLYRNFVDLQSI